MNKFKNDDELSKQLCKIGGPFVLFLCTPTILYIYYQISKKEEAAGIHVSTFDSMMNFIIIALFILFGVWLCKKGYH